LDNNTGWESEENIEEIEGSDENEEVNGEKKELDVLFDGELEDEECNDEECNGEESELLDEEKEVGNEGKDANGEENEVGNEVMDFEIDNESVKGNKDFNDGSSENFSLNIPLEKNPSCSFLFFILKYFLFSIWNKQKNDLRYFFNIH
jgi:hypothetical protein